MAANGSNKFGKAIVWFREPWGVKPDTRIQCFIPGFDPVTRVRRAKQYGDAKLRLTIGGQAAHQRLGSADCGEYPEAAGDVRITDSKAGRVHGIIISL
jgi:hypothetical protein